MVPGNKHVYKTISLNLISHIHDPHYKGEMSSPKIGIFEDTDGRMEVVQSSKRDESNNITDQSGYKMPGDVHNASQLSKKAHETPSSRPLPENHISTLSLTQSGKHDKGSYEFHTEKTADAKSQYEEHENLGISYDLITASPKSVRSVNEFTPDQSIPHDKTLLPYTTAFQYGSRPPSPESVSSVNEFRKLSPDSPTADFLPPSPVPYGHNIQCRQFIHISPAMSHLQKCEGNWMSSEYASLWLETEQRPISPGYVLSECDSRSLSSPSFSFDSTCRCPSPEAVRDIEPTLSMTPDSLIFDIDCRPESPESVTAQTQCKGFMPDNKSHWASDVALLGLTDEQYKTEIEMISASDLATSAKSQRVVSYVLNSGTYHQLVLEPEQEEKIGETRETPLPEMKKIKEISADDREGSSILNTQGNHQKIQIVKQQLEHQQGPEERSGSPTSEVAQQEFKARDPQDKVSEQNIQLNEQNIKIKHTNISVSEEENQSENVNIIEQNRIASSLTREPGVDDPKSLDYIPEGRTVVSSDLDNVHPMISLKQSLEKPKEAAGLCQIHQTPFHFNYQQSHRTVTANLSTSGSSSSEGRNVMSETSFVGSIMFTDLGSVPPETSKLCPNQEPSTNSQLSNEKQGLGTFHHVLCEFEKTESALSTDDLKLVSSEIYPMETALAPSSSEPAQSTQERLMDVDVKAKPRPVQADSLESDTEFFDCQQTFSELSEPELRSEELFDSETVYHVEESLSLPNTPTYDYLLTTPKTTEKSELDSQESPRPASWGSEEIDLPIILEPEDECVGENDEELEYPYAHERSYAEELSPRERGQYDDDDDSLGREIAEELGLLSDSSEEEVLTTRVGDELPEITPHSVTEEQYTDEHGNLVTKKITRKIIRKYVSADGVEREEVMMEGAQQEAIALDDADGFSKVVKRTVVRSAGDQTEVTFSEPVPVCVTTTASEFEGETAQGRKVSKVIKTTVVQGERTEKLIGDPSLSSDLPSAKEDFEKALSYAGGFDKVLLPHLVEKEIVKEDGSMDPHA
ncbi:ankyrin-2 isoform X21 [Clarias magur]|uniref:Ankyrin-2 isoform X21 n=1 Tax=Clarias magur TaxID=1594786 RepID=A0A8J4X9T6_CLAMG|nr:ankyrin-2 isoform X21 [Clarias magur]